MARKKSNAFAGAAEIRKDARALNQGKESAIRKRDAAIFRAQDTKKEFGITTPSARNALARAKVVDHYAKLMRKK